MNNQTDRSAAEINAERISSALKQFPEETVFYKDNDLNVAFLTAGDCVRVSLLVVGITVPWSDDINPRSKSPGTVEEYSNSLSVYNKTSESPSDAWVGVPFMTADGILTSQFHSLTARKELVIDKPDEYSKLAEVEVNIAPVYGIDNARIMASTSNRHGKKFSGENLVNACGVIFQRTEARASWSRVNNLPQYGWKKIAPIVGVDQTSIPKQYAKFAYRNINARDEKSLEWFIKVIDVGPTETDGDEGSNSTIVPKWGPDKFYNGTVKDYISVRQVPRLELIDEFDGTLEFIESEVNKLESGQHYLCQHVGLYSKRVLIISPCIVSQCRAALAEIRMYMGYDIAKAIYNELKTVVKVLKSTPDDADMLSAKLTLMSRWNSLNDAFTDKLRDDMDKLLGIKKPESETKTEKPTPPTKAPTTESEPTEPTKETKPTKHPTTSGVGSGDSGESTTGEDPDASEVKRIDDELKKLNNAKDLTEKSATDRLELCISNNSLTADEVELLRSMISEVNGYAIAVGSEELSDTARGLWDAFTEQHFAALLNVIKSSADLM